MEFKVVQIKSQILLKGEIITKMPNWVGSFKNPLLENRLVRKVHIYMKAFWYNVDSSLYKSVWRGHNRENHICMCLYLKKIFFSRTSRPVSSKQCTDHPWVKRI
jgi:hypothetical protein